MEKHVFISYKHDDSEFAENLIHRVEKEGFMTWIDNESLHGGDDWRDGIDQAIRSAFALIVIMSPTAATSQYVTYEWAFAWGCGIKVIPVMYRKTDLHPRLESLHYLDFTNSIRPWESLMKVLQTAASKPSPSSDLTAQNVDEWLDKGDLFLEHKDYQEALDAFKEAILLDQNSVDAYVGKSIALYNLKRYREALSTSQQAIRLDESIARAWRNKGDILRDMKKYEEALSAYEGGLHLDPDNTTILCNKGYVLNGLKRDEEALSAYEEALRLDPSNALAWHNKGYTLRKLERYEEALSAYEEALRLDPSNALAWHYKGFVLENLGRSEEAEECYNKARELGWEG